MVNLIILSCIMFCLWVLWQAVKKTDETWVQKDVRRNANKYRHEMLFGEDI